MFEPKDFEEDIILTTFRIGRLMKRHIHVSEDEPSILQLQAMYAIIQRDHAHMSDVADDLNMALPTASVLIDKLVKEGLVTRGIDPNDRRVITVQLSANGKSVLKKCLEKRIKKMKNLLTTLSENDKKTLHKILKKLIASLEYEN